MREQYICFMFEGRWLPFDELVDFIGENADKKKEKSCNF